jgi:hypothetical protein
MGKTYTEYFTLQKLCHVKNERGHSNDNLSCVIKLHVFVYVIIPRPEDPPRF